MSGQKTCAVIGGGPAGLIAAEVLSVAGRRVVVYDQMPSLGRKFLMAGVGGLNLTHSEPLERFQARYRGDFILDEMLNQFGPDQLCRWCDDLGQETFIGSSGRVFPKVLKASPLLRAWIRRLSESGVVFNTRHRWNGWGGDALMFETPTGSVTVSADATVLALGGGSWSRLGSDGAWREIFDVAGIGTEPFKPSNCGFVVGWHKYVGDRFGGSPLKSIAVTFGGETVRGEAMITRDGIEGGAIYALSPRLRDEIVREGLAILSVDLKPDLNENALAEKLRHKRTGDSLSNRLRKVGLTPAAIAVLREGFDPLPDKAEKLAHSIKFLPIALRGVSPIDRAISTSGGVRTDSVDARLMLTERPGTFVAGEMLDWEAPTGGYLLQGCFASGRCAAKGALEWLESSSL